MRYGGRRKVLERISESWKELPKTHRRARVKYFPLFIVETRLTAFFFLLSFTLGILIFEGVKFIEM